MMNGSFEVATSSSIVLTEMDEKSTLGCHIIFARYAGFLDFVKFNKHGKTGAWRRRRLCNECTRTLQDAPGCRSGRFGTGKNTESMRCNGCSDSRLEDEIHFDLAKLFGSKCKSFFVERPTETRFEQWTRGLYSKDKDSVRTAMAF